MKVLTGDYVLYAVDRVRHLGQVKEVDGTSYTCVRERHRWTSKQTEDSVNVGEVVLNLGQNPPYGTVYGHAVEPLRRKLAAGDWAAVRIFTDIEKPEYKKIAAAASAIRKWGSELGVDALWPLQLEIRHVKGRYGGHYIVQPEEMDIVVLRIDSSLIQKLEGRSLVKYVEDVLAHEIGHGILAHLMDDELRSRWCAVYHRYTSRRSFTAEQCRTLWMEFTSEEYPSISKFESYLNDENREDDAALFECLLDYVDVHHYLKRKDLQLLLSQGTVVDGLCPPVGLVETDMEQPLTEYANKDFHEFWCEALRLHYNGTQLPKKIQKLMDATLEFVRDRQIEDTANEERDDD